MKIELSKAEVGQALVEFAIRKSGLELPVRHSVQINGVWQTMGDGPPVVVMLEKVHLTAGGEG